MAMNSFTKSRLVVVEHVIRARNPLLSRAETVYIAREILIALLECELQIVDREMGHLIREQEAANDPNT